MRTIDLSDVGTELNSISFELCAISTLFDEDAEKLSARPTDQVIRETLFAISRHIERCVSSLNDIEEETLRKEREAHGKTCNGC